MTSKEERITYKEMYLMYKEQCEEQKEYILKLGKENQELKEENKKLKKVLEIFKSAFVVDLFKETLLIKWKANLVEITEEEHDLLKEVLENE